jgi:hypothetical protein
MQHSDRPSRRAAIGKIAAASLAAAVPAAGQETRSGEMIYRVLGRTGVKVSAVGLGGYHIGVPSEAIGIKIIRTAIDRGMNFMDNCWDDKTACRINKLQCLQYAQDARTS